MKPVFRLRLPADTFTFKPVVAKPKKEGNIHKPLTRILYCVAKRDENGEWKAYINTKGIEGYEDITILPFTEQSFNLKNRNDIFLTKKDEHNHWVRVIRPEFESKFSVDTIPGYTSLCEDCVFSGYIVRNDGKKYFDMSIYQGTYKQCENLITMINRKEDKKKYNNGNNQS